MKLLKTFSVCALMLGAVVTGNAQMGTMEPSFGVKGGVNFANVTGDDFGDQESRTSFHVGVLAEFPLAEIFSLQVEALYSGQGFRTNIPGGLFGGDDRVEYHLDYINVPVLAKVYLIEGLSLEVGPQFGFKVNEKIDFDPTSDDGDWGMGEAKDFDFGIAAGVSFSTQMGLFATGRYVMGVTEVVDNMDAKNSVFQIGIGYKF